MATMRHSRLYWWGSHNSPKNSKWRPEYLIETTMNKRYQALMEQVESVGLNPKCIASSVRDLQDENTKLRQICKEDRDDKEALFKKLENMEQLLDKNVVLESSLSDLSSELKGSQANVKALQESCQSLHGEKSALVSEKAALLSQSQIITENMQKILEKNTVLENSLFGANVELEGLREKSKSLEELCKSLYNDQSNLIAERGTLVVQLDNVERRLENLEMRFAVSEQKYAGMEKEKECTLSQVEELKVSLGVEKQERASFALSSGARLACLENHIQLLQEETRWRKKEFEEELDKAMNAQFEIFVSQKFIQDMEQKNCTLLMECQKHVEASKLTEKLVSELESENPEQQVEAVLLLDEIEKPRMGIYHQVFKALEIGLDNELDDEIANEQIFVHHVIENIEDMKCSLSNYEDDKQQLLLENSVLLTLVGQLRLEGVEFWSEKKILEQEFMTEQLVMVQNEKHRLLEINRQLKSEVKMGDQLANIFKAEMEWLCMQQGDLQRAYLKLQGEYSQVLAENRSLLKNLSELKEEKCIAEEENNFILLETLALDNLSVIFKNFGTEKSVELKLLCEDMHNLHGVNSDLEKEVGVLGGELEMKETENLLLKDSMKKLEEELLEVRDFDNQLRHKISTGKNFLCQKEIKLLEAEDKLKATEDLNSELCRTVEGLKKQHEESILMKENLEKHIFELSEENTSQNKEIECLREVNGNLDSELGILREDVEVHRIREENLSSKLQEIGNNFEIWEAEAATLHFDLQISNIREVLFENKFNELTGVCETLENENASKAVEIEQMKERVSFMETEIGGLKAQLFAYAPAIDSLRDNIASLEHNVLSPPELNVADNQVQKCSVEDLEAAAKLYISYWLELATTPYGSPLDATKMFWPVALPRKSHFKAAAKMRALKLESDSCVSVASDYAKATVSQEKNGDPSTNPIKIIVGADVEMSVSHTRVVTATALGTFISKLLEGCMQYVVYPLWKALTSLSGVQRQVASMVLISWFKEVKTKQLSGTTSFFLGFSNNLKNWLLDLLGCSDPAFPMKDSLLPYTELSRTYAKMRNEAGQLFRAVEASGMSNSLLSTTKIDLESVSADDAMSFASRLPLLSNDTASEETVGRNIVDELESLKQRLLSTAGYLKCVQGNLHVTVCSLVAAAVIWMSELPAKLNPIILPLMASIKREQEEILQNKAAEALAELISHCIARKPSPNDKLIKNLCSLTCMDPCETPQAAVLSSVETIEDQDLLSFGSSTGKQKSKVHMLASGEDRSRVEGFISRRGSELALKHLCKKFGASLFDMIPKLWDCLTEVLKPGSLEGLTSEDEKDITQVIESIKDPQILINNIQVVRSVAPMLDQTLRPKLLTLLPCIFKCIRHSHVAVRLAASRCIASMAKSMTVNVMGAVIVNVIPMLGDMTSVHARQGAGILVSLLVQGLGVELVSYAPLLVVPLLRCMSDCDQSVRQSVTHSFAALVPLLPLARGLSPPIDLSDSLSSSKEDAQFLEQLVDNSHIDDYELSTELKVILRRYQQEGINWLAFLKRFNLHGILCDDMGLGKTLQASAILASDIAEHRAADAGKDPPSSLIICPSTLVGHWVYEIEKFIDASLITTLQYAGSAQERILLRSQFDKHNVIITSYDVVRKDIDYLGQLFWNYCILDEGHIIKNSKSKITCAVKQLKAQHRLVLSGTPIQNNVLDLWSLFDFLMPGFLGTERQFQATYGKPLLAARDSKCSAKDAEAGALAMEALHKQVMPFLLRRTKDEVLSDLPEKIIQDRYCDLSPVQLKLYERFSGSHMRQEISSMVKSNERDTGESSASPRASSHVFQALQYLLKLCGHPLLVIGEKIPDSFSCVLSELFPANSDIISELHKLHHSPKLVALQEILEECGIGVDASSSEGCVSVGQHRVLIFAQHKAFLDIIERDLFHGHMKSVTYLRLDGSVEPEKRFDIVKAFNSDPTIDVLLLTTHVGGLGLNLTSADTLVFMEHDWNPMRDHQAMDRAHRLGQRKVVNVHRLIMRGTLEEKVMSLQKFKVSVANSVINAENASMKTMNTDQLLDLFTSAETKKATAASKGSDGNFDGDTKSVGTGKGLKAILGGLEELWDQSQYTEEYNLSHFLTKLNG